MAKFLEEARCQSAADRMRNIIEKELGGKMARRTRMQYCAAIKALLAGFEVSHSEITHAELEADKGETVK